MPKAVHVKGGVDLVTPAPLAPPGTVQECYNHERGVTDGLSRIDGIRRTDGVSIAENAWPGTFQLVRLDFHMFSGPGPNTPPPTLTQDYEIVIQNFGDVEIARGIIVSGAEFHGDGTITLGGFLFDTSVYSDNFLSIYVLFTVSSEFESSPPVYTVTIRGPGGAEELTMGWDALTATVIGIDEGDFTGGQFQDAVGSFDAMTGDSVTAVPGEAGSDIIGGFWLKNRPYVIRDLRRYYFEDGLYTDANEGQLVTIGASEYEILAVTQTGGGTGFLTLDPVAGSGANATPYGTPTTLTITGTPPDCDVGAPYDEDVAGFAFGVTGGTAPYTWSVVDNTLVSSNLIDADNPNLQSQQTNAALYKADATDGWVRVDTRREMLFSDGGAALENFSRAATTEGAEVQTFGPEYPTDSELNGSATTGVNSDNGVNTALSGASGDIITAQGFDFSDVPSTAVILGITVQIERNSDVGNQAKDNTVTLLGVTGGAENKARGTAWPAVAAVASYGGASDLWGNQSISVTDLQDPEFGVMLVVDRVNPANATVGGVDYIRVSVTYIERDTLAYVWNGTTDQPITINHIAILGGDTADDSAYGYLTLQAPQNADKTRIINVGDEIRSAASGAGDLLALVAARDVPIWFPGQTDIDNNGSQYKAIVENFYGSDAFDAAYIVCGVGPATCFDGERTIRIRTALPPNDDCPRHVARHGEKLALAFYTGALVLSVAGNPLDCNPANGSSAFPVGDRITGLRGRVDDELLICCESSIQYLSGYTNSTAIRRIITRTRGMLEYSDADIGIALGCDGLGLFDIRTAGNYAPADRTYYSAKVAPWLQPRLQATENAGQPNIRLLTAVARRAKDQHRQYYADGYILTATFLGDGTVEFTMQQYVDPSQGDRPLPVRTVFTGIDQSGRERIFGSFRGAKEGFLFEFDAGRSFDGDPIPAHLVFNSLTDDSTRLKRFDRVFLYGSGYGYATLRLSRSATYGAPLSINALEFTMGSEDDAVTTVAKPFRGVVDYPIEGYDVTYRIDSETATEGPYTLQYLVLYDDDRGASRGHVGRP